MFSPIFPINNDSPESITVTTLDSIGEVNLATGVGDPYGVPNESVNIGNMTRFYLTGPLAPGGGLAQNPLPTLLISSQVTGPDIDCDYVRLTPEIGPVEDGTAFCLIDGSPNATGAHDYNHLAFIQDRFHHSGAGTLGLYWSYYSQPQFSGGDVGDRRVVWARDPLGDAALAFNCGLYVDNLTRGTKNWVVYGAGVTPSSFGGNVGIGTGDTAASNRLEISSAVDNDGVTIRTTANTTAPALKMFTGITNAAARNWGWFMSRVAFGDYVLKCSVTNVADPAAGTNMVVYHSNGDIELAVQGAGLIIKSDDGTRWRFRPSNGGVAVFTAL